MEDELYEKIPKKFLAFIRENKDNNYVINIDYSKSINEQELLQQTRVILSLIYRDYLCTEEERVRLIEKDKEEIKRLNEDLREKYNCDNIFNDRKKLEKYDNKLPIEVKNENIIIKILKFIKKLIKKRGA